MDTGYPALIFDLNTTPPKPNEEPTLATPEGDQVVPEPSALPATPPPMPPRLG